MAELLKAGVERIYATQHAFVAVKADAVLKEHCTAALQGGRAWTLGGEGSLAEVSAATRRDGLPEEASGSFFGLMIIAGLRCAIMAFLGNRGLMA